MVDSKVLPLFRSLSPFLLFSTIDTAPWSSNSSLVCLGADCSSVLFKNSLLFGTIFLASGIFSSRNQTPSLLLARTDSLELGSLGLGFWLVSCPCLSGSCGLSTWSSSEMVLCPGLVSSCSSSRSACCPCLSGSGVDLGPWFPSGLVSGPSSSGSSVSEMGTFGLAWGRRGARLLVVLSVIG